MTQPQESARRDYKEKGNINTPMELAINNEIDRFSLAIDAIDRRPALLHGADSRMSIFLIPTDEELEIARQSQGCC